MENNKPDYCKTLGSYSAAKIGKWSKNLESSDTKADLAVLRNFASKRPFDSLEPWPIILDGNEEKVNILLSDFIYNKNSRLSGFTRGQIALYYSLIFFAVHQQGMDNISMHQPGVSLGTALNSMVYKTGADPESIKDEKKKVYRRLKSIAGKKDLFMQMTDLRGIIGLLHSNNIGLDYVRLTNDLFWIQFPDHKNKTLIQWINDFNRTNNKENINGKLIC